MSRAVKGSMGYRRVLRLSPLLSLLSLGACASVLGIEDIHEGPANGTGGDGATGATDSNGGTNQNGGSKNGGSKNGGSSNGGSANPDAGMGPDMGGTGNGDAGAGGAPINTDPTVRGKVIDFWGQKVPNIPIEIAGVLSSTDADGEFVFEDVTAEYDVSLAVQLGPISTHGWVFQGLTRRDPTLHIYSGLPDRDGHFVVQALDVTIGNNQKVAFTIGAVGGADQYSGYQSGLDTSHSWRGGASTTGTAHALWWTLNASDLPTSYQGVDSTLIALAEVGTTDINFTLADTAPEYGALTGTVTPNTSTERENDVFLRFPSGDAVHLGEDYPNAPDNFSYVVPDVAMASVTISASEGYAYYGSYSVAHKDGLGPGGNAALKIPAPGSLVAPVDETTNVNLTTKFSYLAGTGSGAAHVIAVHSDESASGCCFDVLYIATTKTQFSLPEVVGASFLKPAEVYYWRVETHGKYQTVDSMAGPSGFLDSFSADEETPQGPNSGDGQYTVTSSRYFTAAP